MLKRYHKRRQYAIILLGGKCVKCGSKKNLEFDHIKPEDKLFTIAKLWSCPEDIFLQEINKCELKCKTCHTERHATARNTHGTLSSYRYCKCKECRETNNKYMREYKKNKASSVNGKTP